ncbi:hypothetical protein J3A64_002653 [Pseudarthrobacter sp. PvP004]|nr:hypothetical protein [Pseudarthrobacter sp. PvP004]
MTPIRIRQLTSQALGEATYVSSCTTPARLSAPTVRANPSNTLCKAASFTAGTSRHLAPVPAAAPASALSRPESASPASTLLHSVASTGTSSSRFTLR